MLFAFAEVQELGKPLYKSDHAGLHMCSEALYSHAFLCRTCTVDAPCIANEETADFTSIVRKLREALNYFNCQLRFREAIA